MNKEEGLSKTMIFYVCTLSFILGIVLISFEQALSSTSEFWYFGLFLLAVVILILFNLNKKIKIAILIAIFLFLGMWRYAFSIENENANGLASFIEQEVMIKGVIKSDIVLKNNKQKFEIETSEIKIDNWQKINTRVLIYAMAYPRFSYGDELVLQAELKKPEAFDGFAYERYLARHNIYSILYYPHIEKINENKANSFYALSLKLKNRIRYLINRGLRDPESGLARAIILGDGSLVDEDLRTSFSRSGISHIIAISGLHIAIIAGLIAFLLFKIGLNRNQVFYLSAIILTLFIILVGMPASAVRAGIMVILTMYALKIGRSSQIERIIILVACILLFVNPKLLRDDIGFQLSFTAVLGIIYIFPFIKIFLEKIKITNKFKIRDVLGVSIAAQITTGPIAAYYFGILPILGIITNLFVLCILPFLLGSIILTIFLAFIFNSLLVYIFFIPMIILDYIIFVSNLLNKIPFAYIEIEINIKALLLYYLCLILLIVAKRTENI